MTTETIVLKTAISNLFRPSIIELLAREGYQKTGNKFSISFNGSKGYLDHIEIYCEGFQQDDDNRIDWYDLFNRDGSFKKKILNVYHSEKNGVRLSLGSDKARVVKDIRAISGDDVNSNQGLPF